MKKLIVLLLMTCLFINTHAQIVTTSSSSMTAGGWLSTVPYDISDEGTEHEFMFGMGGWSWNFFGYQQRNHCGVEKRPSRHPHKVEIVGSSPTSRKGHKMSPHTFTMVCPV